MAVRSCHTGQPLLPSWDDLLCRAAHTLHSNGKPAEALVIKSLLDLPDSDPCEIARHARKAFGFHWFDFLKTHFEIRRDEVEDSSLDLPKRLWSLGSKLVITTNYDSVLKWACPYEWQGDLSLLSVSPPVELSRLVSGRTIKPTLWHLHGQIDAAADIVLTPDGYEALYSDNPSLLDRHQAALQSLRTLLSTHTFLFVGFSFSDPYFGGQLAWLRRTFQNAPPQHYCLIRANEEAHFRLLGLPIDPITYLDHGEPLIQILAQISALAERHCNDTAYSIQPTMARSVLPEGARRLARPIVGRQKEFSFLKHCLLDGNGSLVPIYGLPGVGKTTLAKQIASDPEILQKYDRGVFWVDVGPTPHIDADLDRLGVQLGVSLQEMQQYVTSEEKVSE